MRYLLALLAIFMMAAAPANSRPQDRTVEVFEVKMAIYDGPTLVGEPTLRLMAGAEAIMAETTPGGYTVRATVSRDTSRPTRFVLNTEVHFMAGSEWRRAGTMEMSASMGESVSAEDSALTPRGNARYRVVATVRPFPGVVPTSARKPIDCPVWKQVAHYPLRGVTLPSIRRAGLQVIEEGDTGNKECCQNNAVKCCGTSGSCCYNAQGHGCCVT